MGESVNFDRAAAIYDETRGFPNTIGGEIGHFLAGVGRFYDLFKIIEVGIGTGRIALPLAPYVGGVYGVDISQKMLRVLQNKQNTEPVYPAQADALFLPFLDNVFDGAIVTHVFHLVADPKQVSHELQRVLKPGAYLLHCWNEENVIPKLEPVADIWQTYLDKAGTSRFRHWKNILDDTGWIEIDRDKFTFQRERSAHGFIDSIRKRNSSSTWKFEEADLEEAIMEMGKLVGDSFSDPTAPHLVDASFNVRVYVAPQNKK